jgi:hypothetical protein
VTLFHQRGSWMRRNVMRAGEARHRACGRAGNLVASPVATPVARPRAPPGSLPGAQPMRAGEARHLAR